MPRLAPPSLLRHLHTSPLRLDLASQTHYQRLNVPLDAPPAAVKKSFYALSKTHHPDVNPSPTAATTFSLLSEAYTTLVDPARRAAYDKTIRVPQPQQKQNPAGGRPPSGLSRRRGSFRGPPPSFHGFGPGQRAGQAARGDAPHFNSAAHKRTHEREDERRGRRRAVGDDDVEFEPQTGMTGHFFIVAGILAATFVAPLVYLQCMKLGRRKKEGR